jgi:hypothetical protein
VICQTGSASADVGFWYIASFRCAARLVAYWTNNGHRSALGLNGSAANDSSATLAARLGDIVGRMSNDR